MKFFIFSDSYFDLLLIVSLICLIASFFSSFGLKNIYKKTVAAFISIAIISLCYFIPAYNALLGDTVVMKLYFIPSFVLHIDALSAWFIIVINLTMLSGSFYGIGYLRSYKEKNEELSLHLSLIPLFHFTMLWTVITGNMINFLVCWEIMSLSSFLLILFEREKEQTIIAARNYFIQMHISILFLISGVLLLWTHTGSFDFSAIATYTSQSSSSAILLLFMLFFIGFGIKAGFVPLHSWLPHAHPAAPSHVSGMMSGVIIKMGIYGIMRVLSFFDNSLLAIGWIVLIISLVSSLYGVMLAVIQHNLKRLLAYHSIENIGIIGMGIGLGTLGIGLHNHVLIHLGFAGALLHTLNHSLFKSLLFYSAGNIYQTLHILTIDKLGGLAKKMPHTSLLFLLGAIAICGLPPLNGFISECIIYIGLFHGLPLFGPASQIMLVLSIGGLALTGGLAVLCFTKAFSICFLGEPRSQYPPIEEVALIQRIAMYAVVFIMLSIAFLPHLYFMAMQNPIALFSKTIPAHPSYVPAEYILLLQQISIIFIVLVLVFLLVVTLRKIAQNGKEIHTIETWGCGYAGSSPRLQYTASSFVETFKKIFRSVLREHTEKNEINGIFPEEKITHITHPADGIENYVIQKPAEKMLLWVSRLRIFQNGQVQSYLLYGFVFILVILLLEMFSGI